MKCVLQLFKIKGTEKFILILFGQVFGGKER